jgi:hypothetical protein
MGRSTSLTSAVAAEIQRLAETGSSRREIAAAVGVHPESLANWAKRGARGPEEPYHTVFAALDGQPRPAESVRKVCSECGDPFYVTPYLEARLGRCDRCRAGHRAVGRDCSVCGREFMAPPSSNRQRCESCVADGRGTCVACGAPTPVEPGVQGVALCPTCRRGETSATLLKPDYVRLTCRGASAFGETRHATRCEKSRIMTRASAPQRLTTFDPSTQTYICDNCHGLVIAAKGAPARQRWLRRRGLLDPAERLGQGGPRSFHDVQELVNRQARAHGSWNPGDVSRLEGHRTGVVSPEGAWKRVAGWWKKRQMEVYAELCRGCGLLTLTARADEARRGGDAAYHRACWDAACGTDEGKRWWEDRLVLLGRGLSKDEVDDRIGRYPAAEVRERQPDREVLTRNFGWAVRHLLGGETQGSIARSVYLSRPVIGKGIAEVLDLLPPPERANTRLRRYVIALREAQLTAAST